MTLYRWSPIVVALAACSHGPKHRAGDEYLKAIKVEGNAELGKGTLVSGLALRRAQKRGRAPDPYLIQVDEDRIRGEYLRKGFLGVDVRTRVERTGDAATVIYTVEEGRRARTRVVISGIPADRDLPVSKIRDQLPLEDGAPFDYAVYDLAKPMLLGVAQDAGYAHAKLDATVFADREHHEAVIRLDYTLGPKCTFGDAEITGVKGDLADAVRNRLQFRPGEQYSTHALVRTQRQLYAMGRFSTVQVQTPDTPGEVVKVGVAVSEAARHEVRLGGGFGIDPTAYEARARIGYSVAGWPYPLDTATIDLRPAYAYLRDGSGWEPRVRAIARLERQDLLWTYARGLVEGGYNYLAVEAYTSYGPRARVAFTTPVKTERLQLGVGWNIERLDFRNVSEVLVDQGLDVMLGLDHAQRVGSYNQSLTIDLRDHPIEPRLGAYGVLRVLEGTKYAAGAYDFIQVEPELRGYVPIGRVVVAARVRSGNFFGDVPATERYFSGGASNHRGFGERRLAPSAIEIGGDQRVVPYGGVALLETGVEARIPIMTWRQIGIGTVVFLDGGDVVDKREDLDPLNLHWAAGAGLRFLTIVGPVRADLGYRLNRHGPMDPSPGSRFAFHLSLGEAF